MDTTEVSEIEAIIKRNIEEETRKSIAQLKEQIERETAAAVERINGVYTSAISTLRKLELTDATIFEFFQKTNGNIRVHEVEVDYPGNLWVELPGGQRINERSPIYLDKRVKYKVILMAMKMEEPIAAAISKNVKC